MNTSQEKTTSTPWISTYAELLSNLILVHFNTQLSSHDLADALHDPSSYYYQLLIVPFKHVYTNLVASQAEICEVFLKKTFLDLLFSQNDPSTPAPDADASKEGVVQMSAARDKLLDLSDALKQAQADYDQLIVKSQRALIDFDAETKVTYADQWTPERRAGLWEIIEPLMKEADLLRTVLCQYRAQLAQLVSEVKYGLVELPNYTPDPDKIHANGDLLHLNLAIGTSAASTPGKGS